MSRLPRMLRILLLVRMFSFRESLTVQNPQVSKTFRFHLRGFYLKPFWFCTTNFFDLRSSSVTSLKLLVRWFVKALRVLHSPLDRFTHLLGLRNLAWIDFFRNLSRWLNPRRGVFAPARAWFNLCTSVASAADDSALTSASVSRNVSRQRVTSCCSSYALRRTSCCGWPETRVCAIVPSVLHHAGACRQHHCVTF